MHFDERYEEEVTLRGGRTVRLRMIRPDDKDGLREGFARLGPESRYARFLAGKNSLSDRELRYLTEVDNIDHVAIVAGEMLPDGTELGLGVARFVRVAEAPHVAEPAVAIVDDAQGMGLGGLMLKRLTDAAVERDVWRFRCPVLAKNEAIKHALAEIQPDVHQEPGEDGVTVLEIALPGTPGYADVEEEEHEHEDAAWRPVRGALRRLLAQAAAQVVELEHRWHELVGDEE